MDRYHHGDLRNALLDAAERRMAADEEPSLRELARHVGVSPGSVYHHFADKDALLGALAIRGFERLLAAQQAAMTAPTPEDRLAAMADAYLGFAESDPTTYRLMMRKDLGQAVDSPIGAAADATLAILVEAVAAVLGREDDARVHALELWATAHGLASLWDSGPLRRKLGGADLRTFGGEVFRRWARRMRPEGR